MITIPRRLASQLRSVLRRAFGSRGTGPAIAFIADKAGLTVKSMSADIAIELHVPGVRQAETLWLPFEFLTAVEAKKDDAVELEATGKGEVTARWQDGSVPQAVKYNTKEPKGFTFPSLPDEFITNPSGLLRALHQASEVADIEGVRYATSYLQLCPNGSINATDGRHALIQSGFTFPWSESVLVPRSKVFNSAEFSHSDRIGIGKSGDWAVLQTGAWTIYLRNNTDGRFPDMTRIARDPDAAKARCRLSADDTRFLAETLPKLPCHDEQNLPVTLDVNGSIAVRARPLDQERPTEVVLTNSHSTGEPVRININRKYLRRAMQLGVQDLCLFGEDAALLGQAENLKYIWMPLEAGAAIKSAEDAIRIESPLGEPAVPVQQPVQPRSVSPMSEPNPTAGKAATNGQTETASAKTTRRKAKQQDLAALIDQAMQLRTATHSLMQQSSVLVKALKQHRRQNRAIQNTLESLKQLKTLGV